MDNQETPVLVQTCPLSPTVVHKNVQIGVGLTNHLLFAP